MFGGDDFFKEIERAFFSSGTPGVPGRSTNRVSRDTHSYVSNMHADYDRVDDGTSYYIIINILDAVHKGDLTVSVEDDDTDDESSDMVLVVRNRSREDSFIRIRIPKKIAKRSMRHTFVNGIVEVVFGK